MKISGGRAASLLAGPAIGALITAALVIAAYQVRPSYDIPFGTATDGPLLRGFNRGEQATGSEDFTFRWATGDAYVTLQDVGRQDFDVVLSVDGSRPPGQPPGVLTVTAVSSVGAQGGDVVGAQGGDVVGAQGGDVVGARHASPLQGTLRPGPQDFAFTVPRESVADGTLNLHLTSNAFSLPGDSRELGVVVAHLKVSPSSSPDRFVEPPVGPIVQVTLAAALLGLVMSLLGWGVGGAGLGSCLVGLLAAWLLVADRLWLTTGRWYSTWLPVLLAGVIFIGVTGLLGGWLLCRGGTPWSHWQRRALLTLMFAVFSMRLAGQMHPQIFIVDLGFHAHRFETVQSGQLLFTIASNEWGGHQTFYLPTSYVFMLPLQWLLHDELLVIKLFTVLVGTLGAFVVFFVARRGLGSGSTGLIASVLYLTLPMSVLPFSWGITTNVFGEFFALCSLAIVVTGYRDLRPNRPAFWALLFTLLMALLSHPGVVQLTLVAFTFISLLWLLSGRILAVRRHAVWLLATLALAFGVAYVVYYGHFAGDMLKTLRDIQAERASAGTNGLHLKVGGSVSDGSLGLAIRTVNTRSEWLVGGLVGFWQEAQAYYRVWPIAGAALGYALIWPAPFSTQRRRGAEKTNIYSLRLRASALGKDQQDRALLVLVAAGWSLAVMLFAIVGWVMNLYVRYALFALPVVALGAGVLLSAIRQKGRVGAWLAGMMLVFFAVEALALWQYRITYALK